MRYPKRCLRATAAVPGDMNAMNEIFKSKRRESGRAANIKVSANIHWSKLFTWGGGTALREVWPGSDAAQLEQTSLHTGRKHHPHQEPGGIHHAASPEA